MKHKYANKGKNDKKINNPPIINNKKYRKI